jgi:nucleoside-diphosphate-sugar epimerase
MKERVLITGASGFLGYHLILEALKNNLEVYAAVRKSSDITHLKKLDINYVYLDLSSVIALKKDIRENKYSYIIHAAGLTKARWVKEYEIVNADYTYHLASAAESSGVDIKGFVLISSLAAVGPLESLTGIITEENRPKPVTPYGKSKLLAEEKLKTIKSLKYTILRPTAIYGPRDKDIFIFFKQLKTGIEPYIGRDAQKLSFIYVKDLAAVTIKSLYKCNQNTYNLSDGNFYDKYELGFISKKVLNLKTVIFHLPVIFVKFIAAISKNVSSLSGKGSALNPEKVKELMALNWFCSIEKAKHELGYYPQYDLNAGLEETLKWYKDNKWL